jgi:hypothetical protein
VFTSSCDKKWRILGCFFSFGKKVRRSRVWAVWMVVWDSRTKTANLCSVPALVWDLALSCSRRTNYMSGQTLQISAFNICNVPAQCSVIGGSSWHDFPSALHYLRPRKLQTRLYRQKARSWCSLVLACLWDDIPSPVPLRLEKEALGMRLRWQCSTDIRRLCYHVTVLGIWHPLPVQFLGVLPRNSARSELSGDWWETR